MATPLERQFSTIAGIDSMSSTNSQGYTSITVQFTLDRNIDAAAQDVQAAISAAGGQLPHRHAAPAFLSEGESGRPADPLSVPHFHDAAAVHRDEYADTLLAQRISMVSGVSHVQVYGEQKYAVRVQVDPDPLAAHGIGIDEVQRPSSAAQRQSAHRARCTAHKQAFTIQSNGQLTDAAAYRPLIVAYRNGTPVRLEQLGNVLDSVENDKAHRLV